MFLPVQVVGEAVFSKGSMRIKFSVTYLFSIEGIHITDENEGDIVFSCDGKLVSSIKKELFWDLPGGPVVRTLCFSRGCRFNPCSGTRIPHTAKKRKKDCN